MKLFPWFLSLTLAAALVLDHSRSTLSWVSGYEAGVEQAARTATWVGSHPRLASAVASSYLRLQGAMP